MSVSVAAGNLPMRLLRRKIHKRNLKLRQRNLKLRAAEGAGTAGSGRAGPGPGGRPCGASPPASACAAVSDFVVFFPPFLSETCLRAVQCLRRARRHRRAPRRRRRRRRRPLRWRRRRRRRPERPRRPQMLPAPAAGRGRRRRRRRRRGKRWRMRVVVRYLSKHSASARAEWVSESPPSACSPSPPCRRGFVGWTGRSTVCWSGVPSKALEAFRITCFLIPAATAEP